MTLFALNHLPFQLKHSFNSSNGLALIYPKPSFRLYNCGFGFGNMSLKHNLSHFPFGICSFVRNFWFFSQSEPNWTALAFWYGVWRMALGYWVGYWLVCQLSITDRIKFLFSFWIRNVWMFWCIFVSHWPLAIIIEQSNEDSYMHLNSISIWCSFATDIPTNWVPSQSARHGSTRPNLIMK